MPKKNIETKLYVADSGAGGGSGNNKFFVDTDELSNYSAYLKENKGKLVDLLSNLKTEMSSITNGWSDQDGAEFKSKFDKFISEAEKINTELETLSSFASKENEVYQAILSECLDIMNGGG